MHICMESFPSKITIEILSLIPTDSVLQCRQVCKRWRHLLLSRSFAHKHVDQLLQLDGNSNSRHSSLIASKVASGFLFSFAFTREPGRQLYYGEYENQSNKKLRRINQPPIHHQSIVGSCNGLICYSKDGNGPQYYDRLYEPTYVSNPVTSAYASFDEVDFFRQNKVHSVVYGFGYHHSLKKYEVVRIYYNKNQTLGQVQVYTLGCASGWRDLGETAYCSLRYTWPRGFYNCSPFATLANGALHWLDKEQKIVSFDLASEKLYLLPPPPFVRSARVMNYFELQVLGGSLCFLHQKENEFLDIWFFRSKGEFSSYNVNGQDYDSLSWNKEYSIPVGRDLVVPFSLTKSGEVLLHYRSSLFCYDPQTAVSENLMSNNFYHVVPHINSLVSFKDLGEQSWGRKIYDVNPAPKEIFIKQRRKGNRETDVNPSLTMSEYLGKQAVSPIQAIDSDSNLNKSIPTVGVEASHSSKVADRNVGGSRKIKEKSLNCKSHCSNRSPKRASSPQELYCSDENSPLNSPLSHRSRPSIREGGSGVGGTKKIIAEVEEFFDDDGNIGGTCREVSATLPLRRVLKRHRDGSDMNDQGSEKSGRARGPDVGQPRERVKGSSLMSPLGCSKRGQGDRPFPEYTSPQLCPPSFLMVAGFPVLPKYKDLYTRVIASKRHMASDTNVKSMTIQATMITELLETIQQMSELSGRAMLPPPTYNNGVHQLIPLPLWTFTCHGWMINFTFLSLKSVMLKN